MQCTRYESRVLRYLHCKDDTRIHDWIGFMIECGGDLRQGGRLVPVLFLRGLSDRANDSMAHHSHDHQHNDPSSSDSNSELNQGSSMSMSFHWHFNDTLLFEFWSLPF